MIFSKKKDEKEKESEIEFKKEIVRKVMNRCPWNPTEDGKYWGMQVNNAVATILNLIEKPEIIY